MIYPIVIYGSPMLRRVSKEIDKNDEGLAQLVEDMFETMKVSDGVGLAAPQIGKSLRMFVIDGSDLKDEEPSLDGFRKAFINPQIVEEDGELWAFNEGCLSLPGIREEVNRQSNIRIQYYDEHFNFYDEEYTGVAARIIQHEYDHLEGILFVDLLSPLKKKLIKGKLNAISKGKVDTDYKAKILK